MKIHPEDPRLTAFLLGELAADEAADFQNAIDADPALQKTILELQDACAALHAAIVPAAEKLSTQQRLEIIQMAREPKLLEEQEAAPIRSGRWVPWTIPAAAAAAVLLAVFVIKQLPKTSAPVVAGVLNKTPKSADTEHSASTKVDHPVVMPAPIPRKIEVPTRSETISGLGLANAKVSERPSVDLPMIAIQPNLDLLTQSIRIERRRPEPDSVHLEQLLNSFTYQFNGITSIARSAKTAWHPDARESGMTTLAATLSAESIACPWRPSATLILVSIKGNPTGDCNAHVVFRPNAAAIYHYRVLGSVNPDGSTTNVTSHRLPAGLSTTVAIEVEPSALKGDFGVLEWSVNQEPATTVPLARNPQREPSNDARFAALVCAYSQWLAGKNPAIIDSNLIAAFAREVNASDLPADRADFIKLIQESLNL